MDPLLSQHIENLKSTLLSLPATGEKGFEGLIGTALREISGVPFRLAGSGSQFGVDGKPTYDRDVICFEGKRYVDTVPRTEVLSKIAELSIRDTEIDIWVLGATSQIRSQLADDARNLGIKNGIFVLILDWSETDLPPFAVALAMGRMRVHEFLRSNLTDKMVVKAVAALEFIRNSQDFSPHAERIRAQCHEPSVGWALAQRANVAWLIDGFSSRKRAKIKFGQPLSPGDTDMMNVRQRWSVIDKLHPYLSNARAEAVVFILGGEGHGKSWIVAQSWLTLVHKPLMVFLCPDDFVEMADQDDVAEFLIPKFIKQTEDRKTATTLDRWRRRLEHWRGCIATDSPRLIVVIDGINQRPKSDWARIIERIADELDQLGGCLIVTARTQFFRDRIKGRLSVPFSEITVPEWSETERDEILTGHGIKASDLQHSVASSLRNPRLLGIALELLGNSDVTNFEELSVSRLLFEHMRVGERDAQVPQLAWEFARRLQNHAQEIMSRVKAKQKDDLTIFEDDVGAVADGRFFQAIDGDPMRYSLKDDGLTLALGFAVLDRLCIAQRNGRNLDAELDAILEPIAALDVTADVILAALTVTALDDHYERDIGATIIKGFAMLQNPDQIQFPAFASLAKKKPQSFMDAARALSLAGSHQPNFDWIQEALIAAGRNSHAWQEMAIDVHIWLSVYSLSPELGTFLHPSRDPQEKVQEEREKNRKKIKERLGLLSATELAILRNLSEEMGNLSSLSSLALLLLAGKALEPFAKSLVHWSFSNALNSDHAAPYKDFTHLVSLNRVDWSQTRASLLEMSAPLRKTGVSKTGKWALVNILWASGHSDDSEDASALMEELNKDWPSSKPWRLIEEYCETDPCDPASEKPYNLTSTAERYAAINVSKLRQSLSQSSEDHFFEMARVGIVRFLPDVAVAKHRELVADVLNREGLPLRQGLLELHHHNALLTIEDARELVKKWDTAKSVGGLKGLSGDDAWLVSQYLLLLAFPFLTALEQAEILLATEDGSVMRKLLYLAKPLGEKEFENLLETACSQNKEHFQYLLLGFGEYTSVRLSPDACKRIATLFQSQSERVRAHALGVIARSGDETLLDLVAKSDWKATDAEAENSFEAWYGSVVLLKAAARGLMAHDEALARISARLYGWAATMLDKDAVRAIAFRIDASIKHTVGLKDNFVALDIEIKIPPSSLYEPSMFHVTERLSGCKDDKEAVERLLDGKDAFKQRQNRNIRAFLEFKASLTHQKVGIIFDHLNLSEFETIALEVEQIADSWYDLFLNICEAKLPIVHNLVLLLAHALARKSPDKAKELFRLVTKSRPLVSFTFGKAGVQLDAMAMWAGGRNAILDELRFARLDRVGSDHDFSLEVLTALLNHQQELLKEYIEAKLLKKEPSEISRGIMVAGFSDQSKFNDEILKRFEGSAGLIGSAHEAAKYAYEHNVWARHWFEMMCQTDDNTDFWRYAILFSRIVDGRFDMWHSDYVQDGGPIKSFRAAVMDGLENRFKQWENHRKKKLFGSDAPVSLFVEEVDLNE